MSETHADPPNGKAESGQGLDPSAAPPLNATVRRHLGQTLRGHYADTLSAPVDEHLEALLAKLDKPTG